MRGKKMSTSWATERPGLLNEHLEEKDADKVGSDRPRPLFILSMTSDPIY